MILLTTQTTSRTKSNVLGMRFLYNQTVISHIQSQVILHEGEDQKYDVNEKKMLSDC